jgi:hypothetical protein
MIPPAFLVQRCSQRSTLNAGRVPNRDQPRVQTHSNFPLLHVDSAVRPDGQVGDLGFSTLTGYRAKLFAIVDLN